MMFEIPTSAASLDAIRRAHAERGRMFARFMHRVTHPFGG